MPPCSAHEDSAAEVLDLRVVRRRCREPGDNEEVRLLVVRGYGSESGLAGVGDSFFHVCLLSNGTM